LTNTRALGGALSWREFARRYPFPLDPFQEEALAALEAGGSVLVAAPTGTGKTVVAEYAMERALRLGTRAVYTRPSAIRGSATSGPSTAIRSVC
jgi:superfamily II RNA helicase